MTGDTMLMNLGHTKVFAGYTKQIIFGELLLKLSVKSQTVIELCSFEKGAILPHLKCIASATPYLPNHLVCLSIPCGLTELSSILHGNQVPCRAWTFRAHLCESLLFRNQTGRSWAMWLHCEDPLLFPLQPKTAPFPQ